MIATISCKCGWRTERTIENDARLAEILANAHETSASALRRPYAHETIIIKEAK